MQRIVQKFGGTSVGSISKIIKACELIQKEFENGNQVVVFLPQCQEKLKL